MINKFEGEFEFLSNFYESPISDGKMEMPTVEHYFQAAKTANKYDYIVIATSRTPGEAKRKGRRTIMREDWEEVKLSVMKEALRKKFAIPELRQKLIATGPEYLEEGNWWHDNFWGVCHCEKCQDKRGQNNLGKLLMEIRAEIMEEKRNV